MKATELMIGDWVQYNCDDCKGKPTKIETCDFDAPQFFDPIPITTEILEKNGAEIVNDIINIYRFDGFSLSHEYDTEDGDLYWGLTIATRNCDVSLISIHYVHELQHALRMCRIKKEIEL